MGSPESASRGARAALRRALGSPTARATAVNAAGTAGSAGLAFLALVVAAQAMGPAAFGLFSLALAVLSITAELADLGVNAGLIRNASACLGAGDHLGARSVLTVGLRAKAVTASTVGLLVAALAGPAAAALRRPEAEPLLRLAALGLAGAVLQGLTSAALQAHQRFARNAALGVSHWALRLAGTLAVVAAGNPGPELLLRVYALSPWAAFGLGLILIPRGALGLGPWDRRCARQVFRFGRWMAVAGMCSILLSRLDLILVGLLASDREAGLLAASQRVSLLMLLLMNAYLMTLIPHLSRLSDGDALRRATRRALRVSVAAAGGVAFLIPAAPWVVALFGDGFAPAAPVLRLLLLGAAFQTLALPFSATLYALDRPQAIALAGGLGLLLSLAGNLALIPHFGALGAGITAAAVGLELLTASFVAARRR